MPSCVAPIDVASALALRLMEAGYAVLLVESTAPAVTRRGQSFADAAFDGTASLEGVLCRRVDTAAAWTLEQRAAGTYRDARPDRTA